MKEAIVSQGDVKIIDSPIPVPQKGQVLIRVVVAGSNPKDVKSTFWLPPSNFGDDIAGYVESVGDGVLEFRPNDRVAAFHEMFTPHGAFAEYAIAWAHTTFRLPANVSFEEAATVPLTSMTAALGLYSNLRLPLPWTTDEDRPETGPLIIYGAGAAVGSFAVQFARKSESKDHVETLIDSSKGDVVIDYRLGPETVLAEIKKALGGKPLLYAFDAVADYGSDKILGAFLHPESGRITMTLPKDGGVPEGVEAFWTAVGTVHNASRHFEGWLKPHPHEVLQGGLNGLPVGLAKLLEGKAHGVKYVYRIADTKA
ncbi:chaperonin 10-like protein [Ilyonectria sp. MPI-CAGE-AT-0026]|nr:chaperonin 10-like protein [Ilyonectria sp. MPI-CAGE-AT-0026]